MKKEFFDDKPIIDEEDDDVSWQEAEMYRGMNSALAETSLEVGRGLSLEEGHHRENVEDIEKRIGSIKFRIEKIEEALSSLRLAYEEAESGERAGFRSMIAAGRYALQRAEQDLSEVTEALGERGLD